MVTNTLTKMNIRLRRHYFYSILNLIENTLRYNTRLI